MKVQSTFYPDFISKAIDLVIIGSFMAKNYQIIDIWCISAVKSQEEMSQIHFFLRCKIFSLKLW